MKKAIKIAEHIIHHSEKYADKNGSFRIDMHPVTLTEDELGILFEGVQEVFAQESHLMEINGPCNVVGDIHGQYSDMAEMFRSEGRPPLKKYVFLGDYVDRGKNSLDVIVTLFAYKLLFPKSIYLVRGNHESEEMNVKFGFYEEVVGRYSKKLMKLLWIVFDFMSITGLIDGKYFCMHGGLSPDLKNVRDVARISKPTRIQKTGIVHDILWSDPDDTISGFGYNERRKTWYRFGADVIRDFVKRNNLECIIRAHECYPSGFKYFAKGALVTIFSAPNYGGRGNSAVVAKINNYGMQIKTIWAKERPVAVSAGQKRKYISSSSTDVTPVKMFIL